MRATVILCFSRLFAVGEDRFLTFLPDTDYIFSGFFEGQLTTSPFGVLSSPGISYKTPNYCQILPKAFHLPMATLTRPKSLPQAPTNSLLNSRIPTLAPTNSLLNSRIPTPFPIDQLYQDSYEDHRPSLGSNDLSPPENVQVATSTDSTIEGPSATTLVSSRSTSYSVVLFTFTLGRPTATYCSCSEVLSNDP